MIEKYDEAWKYDSAGEYSEALRSAMESYKCAITCHDAEWKEKTALQCRQLLQARLNDDSGDMNGKDFIGIATSMADIGAAGMSEAMIGNIALCGLLAWSSIAMWLFYTYKEQDNGGNVAGIGGFPIINPENVAPTDISVYYREIDALCQEIFQNNGMKSMKTAYSTLRKFMDNYTSGFEKLSRIETQINENYDGILEKIMSDFPTMKREDYLLFIYSCLGFSNVSIALFLNEDKVMAIYNRRKRLKKRIRESGSLYKERYIGLLTSGPYPGS